MPLDPVHVHEAVGGISACGLGPSQGARLDSLPVELCMMIADLLDDRCFTWFILRRVSRYFRGVAEALLGTNVLQNTIITFNGSYVRENLYMYLVGRQNLSKHSPQINRNLTLRFKPVYYAPGDTRDRLVLRVDESESLGPHDLQSCECLTRSFFLQSDEQKELLAKRGHLVRLFNDLRCSRLPSVVTYADTEELSLDWRRLCQLYFKEELMIRRARRPWIRSLDTQMSPFRQVDTSVVSAAEIRESLPRDLWIFWDSQS